MRTLVLLLEALWAVANVVLAYFFVTSAFRSLTVLKEGLLAQLVLLVAGVGIEVFAVALLWHVVRILPSREAD